MLRSPAPNAALAAGLTLLASAFIVGTTLLAKWRKRETLEDLVLSRLSSGLFRAIFAMKEIWNGKEIHRRVSP